MLVPPILCQNSQGEKGEKLNLLFSADPLLKFPFLFKEIPSPEQLPPVRRETAKKKFWGGEAANGERVQLLSSPPPATSGAQQPSESETSLVDLALAYNGHKSATEACHATGVEGPYPPM